MSKSIPPEDATVPSPKVTPSAKGVCQMKYINKICFENGAPHCVISLLYYTLKSLIFKYTCLDIMTFSQSISSTIVQILG